MRPLRIVCHNVFWFQGRPFASDRPDGAAPEILEPLVHLYHRLAPDALCLQEIQSRAVFEGLGERLGMTGAYCPGGTLAQYGGVVFWTSGGRVTDSRSLADPPERMWQIVDIGAVRVANVHLPSSRHLGEGRAADRRLEEVRQVVDRDRRPDVVVGDFNEQPGGPLGKLLTDRGYRDAAALTGRTHIATTPAGRRNDQIWVIERRSDAVTDYGAVPDKEMRTDAPGKEHLSDHFPVWIELAVGPGG